MTTDSILTALDMELIKENYYIDKKTRKITKLKNKIYNESIDLSTQYIINELIFEEYKSFKYDSAFNYINQVLDISYQLSDYQKIASAKIKLGFIYLSSGIFKEAFDTLGTIKSDLLSKELRSDYYSLMAILYYGLSDLQDQYYAPLYEVKAHLYVDSLLNLSDRNSYKYIYYKGLRHVRKSEFKDGLDALELLRTRDNLSLHQNAIISSTMSDVYINIGDNEKAIELLAEASIYDIASATKETAAILNLANLLYRDGNIKRAYIYTKQALEDANFYGARHRKIQVGSILPIIEEEKLNTVEKQKRMLLVYSLVVTILSLVIVLFIIIILRQIKRLRRADREIIRTNNKLRNSNQKLLEANKIKEEYIGYYFSIISNYIDKIKNLKASIENNLATNKIDNIRYIVKKINLDKERKALYQGFDNVFLRLFPDFINDFNNLFKEEDKIQLADNELLNTDLRIFALIRLGITENDKIARILEFSVNTIYTYKTKIKNKSIVTNDEFEDRIMEIKFI